MQLVILTENQFKFLFGYRIAILDKRVRSCLAR